jgi:uncharacterized repeat protein (TIGR02543 family)
VNLVAHSFGGLLVRTYLEGLATNLGPIGILGIPYRNDVNRVMTLGTPHQGIGGPFSTIFASACAAAASVLLEPFTCYEADSGAALFGQSPIAPGTGDFLRRLDSVQIPALQTSLTPQYDIIIGQRMGSCNSGGVCSLEPDDGLITTAGNELCGGSPVDVCSGLPGAVLTEINPGFPFPFGLCHSSALFNKTCDAGFNFAMAEINGMGNPLFDKICDYLECKPAINLTLSDQSAGTVTSDPKGINCGPSCNPPGIDCGSSCTALFDKGTTVTLTQTPSAGHTFIGWGGDCSGTTPTCVLMVAGDHDHLQSGYQVSAVFSEPAGVTLDSASCTEMSKVVTLGPSSALLFREPTFQYLTFTCVFSGSLFGPANTELDAPFPGVCFGSDCGVELAAFPLVPPEVTDASPQSSTYNCGSWSTILPQYRGLFPQGTLCIRGGTSDQGPRTTWSLTTIFDSAPASNLPPSFDVELDAFTTDFSGNENSARVSIRAHVVPF